jgi:hypothetical protein
MGMKMAWPQERWQIVRYDMQKRKVLHTFDTEEAAEGFMLDNPTSELLYVERDPAVSWGDGKKARYGPTYASECQDDVFG